jgi:hypothetical protein
VQSLPLPCFVSLNPMMLLTSSSLSLQASTDAFPLPPLLELPVLEPLLSVPGELELAALLLPPPHAPITNASASTNPPNLALRRMSSPLVIRFPPGRRPDCTPVHPIPIGPGDPDRRR